MALVKYLHILTLASLAILHSSLHSLPVNALSVERGHLGRDLVHAHAEIAKKRDDSSKKCKPRPHPSSASPSPTSNAPDYHSPASSSYSPQPTSTQPSSTSGSSVNTKGLMDWANQFQVSLPHFIVGNKKRFINNWKLKKYDDIDVDSLKDHFEFVPAATTREQIYQIPNVLKKGYARYAMFVNEPEVGTQGNMEVGEAYELWMKFFKPLKHLDYDLGLPAVTTGEAGLKWIKDFLARCNGACDATFGNAHFYGLTFEEFKSGMDSYYEIVKLPIWAGECGCHDYGHNPPKPCTQGVFDGLFSAVMDYVEKTDHIKQIGWFGFFHDDIPNGVERVNIMVDCPTGNNKDCKPNALGQRFLSY